MKTPNIIEHLKTRFQQKRSAHPSFKLMKIDDSLFPNGIIIPFEAEAKDSNNKLKTVKDIVAESWKKGEKNHLMIQGEGGIGKTVTLLSLPVMFNDNFVPAIYIPLHELRGGRTDDMIESYIKKRVLDDDEELFRQLKELRKKEWNNGPGLLLFLDGFNEISNELRGMISEDIEQWSEYYPGVQIITSSRFDIHQYVYLRSSFSKIELQPLSEDTVLKYLENNGIDAPQSSVITKLITNPLLLTLYIKTETIRRERPAPFAKFLETKNAGTLIWNYLQSELWRFRKNSREGASCVLAMEFIAPFVAWTMLQKSEFVVNESSFLDRIGEAYWVMKKHIDSNGVFPEHIKTTLKQSTVFADDVGIGKLLKESLCLFIGNEGTFRLMHQQFRDALAAMHLINSIYLSGDSRPSEWNSIIDPDVMQFVADLISEDEAERLWEQNRISAQIESATRNQLELQRRLHNYDFSTLNFSGLDLSTISLYPYRVGNTMLKLPINADAMNEVKISEKTFFPEGHTDDVVAVAVTTDGKRIVSGSRDNTIRIWDMESGECLKTLKGQTRVDAVAITPDGKRIVSGSRDSTIRVWDLETGSCLKILEGHTGDVTAVAVTPNGKRIISGSDDNTVRVWDLETGARLRTLKGHKKSVNAVAVTPNGKRIISGSDDNTVRVWDLETGARLKTLEGHEGWVTAVAVTSDGKRIVSNSCDNTIRVWDMGSRECLKTLEGQSSVNAVAITPDGKHIVIGSSDNTIRIWDMESGSCLKTLEGHHNSVVAIAVTSDGRRIVSGSVDHTIRIWDMERGKCMKVLKGNEDYVYSVVTSLDCCRIVSSSNDHVIRIWDLKAEEYIKTYEFDVNQKTPIAITSDGKCIFGLPDVSTLCVWNLEVGSSLKTIERHGRNVNVLAVSPDGKCIIGGFYDGTLRIWDSRNGECITTMKGHKGSVNAVVVSPDGRYVVSGSSDFTVRIWDLERGKCTKILRGHEDKVYNVAVPLEGDRVVSLSGDETICIWKLETGKLIRIFKGYENRTLQALAPDGKHVVSSFINNVVRIWDYETGNSTGQPLEGTPTALDMSLDGHHVIYGTNHGMIYVVETETNRIQIIRILPLSVIGFDFSKAIISTPELKEQLRQNGAKV